MSDVPDPHTEAPAVEPRRRRRCGPVIAVAVAAVLAAFIAVLATRRPPSDRIGESALVGSAAPIIDAPTLTGSRFRLSDHKGQWVVVNLMASWCDACKIEHPELVAFAQRHVSAGDAAVVGIAVNDDPGDTRRFFADRGGDWPVVSDTDGSLAVAYGMVKLPESYLVDPNGFVRVKFIGGLTADGIDQQIQSILAGGSSS